MILPAGDEPSGNGSRPPDAIVIGSGFGGTIAAAVLVEAGFRTLLLERGDWVVRGSENRSWWVPWGDREAYSHDTPYHVHGTECPSRLGAFHCVGGPSVFYGGVALRLREADFRAAPDVSGDLCWPFGYAELEPHYDAMERLLGVSGDAPGVDPTDPPRERPLPRTTFDLSPTSRALRDSAVGLGYRPFRLPLAINESETGGRSPCTRCGTCDGFACAIGAKNDLATAVLPGLLARGLRIRPNTVVTGLTTDGARIDAVHAVDRVSGEPLRFTSERVVLAAGALATPHLLLSSELERQSPAGDVIGRNLMRHCNAIVAGAAPGSIGDPSDFRKQFGIHDLYLGDPSPDAPAGKLGAIQQLRATRIALSMAPLPAALKRAIDPFFSRVVAFIVLAEDQPRPENRITIDPAMRDRYGRPVAHVHHRHTPRDLAARRHLGLHAARILKGAGCAFTASLPVRTFSHGLGGVRMGDDPLRFPVAADGRFRGIENLWITDGSLFPTSGAVNPSLTIAANARRIALGIAADRPRSRAAPRRTAKAGGEASAVSLPTADA